MKRQNHKGQSLVEFAIIIPLLALTLFAIIQYGLIFAAHITLRNASAVAARHAILNNPKPTVADIQAMAQSAISPMLSASKLQFPVVTTNVTVGGTCCATSVELTYNLPLIVPFVVPGASGSTLAIHATTIAK